MFCKYCGHQLGDGAAFCPNCGKAVTSGAAENMKKVTAPEINNVPSQMLKPEKSGKSGKGKSVMIFSAAVLIVMIGVVCGLFYASDYCQNRKDVKANGDTVDESNAMEEMVREEGTIEQEAITGELQSAEPVTVDETPESEVEATLDTEAEDEVAQIREWYYDTQNDLENCRQDIVGNATYYYRDEKLVKIAVKEGTDGWGYAREYYFHDNAFYFAFIFSGSEEHRLYLKDDQLIRYIDENNNIYDNDDAENFLEWKESAVQEAHRLGKTGMMEEKQ